MHYATKHKQDVSRLLFLLDSLLHYAYSMSFIDDGNQIIYPDNIIYDESCRNVEFLMHHKQTVSSGDFV